MALHTPRLVLRPLAVDDAQHFVRLLADDVTSIQMMATMPDPITHDAAGEWIALRMREHERSYGIMLRNASEFIGAIGVGGLPKDLEVGYWIGRDFWGHGYATEALTAVLDSLRHQGVRSLRAGTFPHNIASAKVLEKVGFRKIGSKIRNLPRRGGIREVDEYTISLSLRSIK